MGTLGGNLCVDTRCNYYNQTYEWRKAIDFCMKKDGEICLVAPGSPRCWAVSSSDTAPVLWRLGREVRLAGPRGERTIPSPTLYQDDGIQYLTKQPDEILTEIVLPPADGWRSAYLQAAAARLVRLPGPGRGRGASSMDGDDRRARRASCWARSPRCRARRPRRRGCWWASASPPS